MIWHFFDEVKELYKETDRLMKEQSREMKVMGGVAAMVMQENVAKYAYRKGLFVLGVYKRLSSQ